MPDPTTTIRTRDPDSFASGAWFAFNEVLGWINTWDEQTMDKAKLYKAVMDMRPRVTEAASNER
jgi:hypothetical protein